MTNIDKNKSKKVKPVKTQTEVERVKSENVVLKQALEDLKNLIDKLLGNLKG